MKRNYLKPQTQSMELTGERLMTHMEASGGYRTPLNP